jgi:hypothetical protein
MRLFLFLLFLVLLLPLASSHLAAGEDKVVGEYIVDFGYEPEKLTAGENSFFAIHLKDKESKEVVPFTDVWVRISQGDAILFSGLLNPTDNVAELSYYFSVSDHYEIKLRFRDGEKTLAETTFIVDVARAVGEYYQLAILGLLIVAWFWLRRRNSKNV